MKKNIGRHIVIYPYLFAIVPLLNLYVTNIHLVEFSTVLYYLLGIWVVIVTVYLITKKLLKTNTTAGLLVTIITIAILWYGAFYEALGKFDMFKGDMDQYLLPIWLIGLGIIILWLVIKQPNAPIINKYLNFLSVILLVIILYPQVFQLDLKFPTLSNPITTKNSTNPSINNSQIKPDNLADVYYIILDAHARSNVLKEYYGFDNSNFIKSLEARGFYVAAESRSNYPQTAMSLVSSLNMNYLGPLGVLDDGLSQGERISRSVDLWNNPYIFDHFKNLGYTILSFKFKGSFAGGELPLMFMNTTIGRVLFPTFAMRLHRQNLLNIFDELENVPEIETPTFTYAHILAPHPPFVFDREGRFTGVTGHTKDNAWFPPKQFNDQLYFVEQRTLEVIDTILDKSESQPIIIIQGDHGTFSTGMKARETLPILNAYLLPEDSEQFLYPSITPVNTFRLISDIYFDTDFKLLPDRSFVAPTLNEYDSLCETDNFFPDDTDPTIWRENVTEVIKEHNYHFSVVTDCEFQKLILMKDTFQLPGIFEGEHFRWVGSSQKLQLPIWTTGEDYVFNASVHYLIPPPPRSPQQAVSLLIDHEPIDEIVVRPGRQIISFIIPAEKLNPEEGFVRIELSHSNSKQYQGKDFALMYFWIEWKPFSVYLPEFVNTKQAGPDNSPLINLNPVLQNIGIDPQLQTAPGWGIGIFENDSLLWLGHGKEEGLGGTLWATEQTSVQVQVQVQPGPGREDSLRHAQAEIANAAGTQAIQQMFDAPTTLDFEVELQPGRNDFNFYVLDEATVLQQPNGDTRPLLVLLRQVTIKPLTGP